MAETQNPTVTDDAVIRTVVSSLSKGDWVRFNDRTNPLEVTDSYGAPNFAAADVVGPSGGEYTLKVDRKPRVINHPSSGGEQSAVLRSIEVVDPEDASKEDSNAANAMRRLLSSLETGDRVRVEGAAFDEKFKVGPHTSREDGTVSRGVHLVKFLDNPMKHLPRYYRRTGKSSGGRYMGKQSVGIVRKLTVYYAEGGRATVEADE